MTTTSTTCADRRCPGEIDADGFCRLWGHQCAGAVAGAGAPEAPPPRPRTPRGDVAVAVPAGSDDAPWEHPVVLPVAEDRDPLQALLSGPLPSHARRCGNTECRIPISAPEIVGYCPDCGHPYSFEPPLSRGDVAAGRYLIDGCLGYGGVGWVFLARDQILDHGWRVLKGQRNSRDPLAAAAFLGERQALIDHEHQRIVGIRDVVPPGPGADTPYLVMEYVPGGTLEEARARAGEPQRPRAVDLVQALGFGDQILDALSFLHQRGLLYCDLKPDNVMRVPPSQDDDPDPIKLVDFGAVRRIDDRTSPPWGTRGMEAPEVGTLGPAGPSVRSDVYTVGRTLAALTLASSTAEFVARFPPGKDMPHRPAGTPEVFLRLLARATAADPADRFGSAPEMREQLRGVRRQLRAAASGQSQPARSTLFSPSACAFALHVDERAPDLAGLIRQLPIPLVDQADPAAAFLASLGPDSDELLEQLDTAPGPSAAVIFRKVRVHLSAAAAIGPSADRHGRAAAAIRRADDLLAGPDLAHTWTLDWHRGLSALIARRGGEARHRFDLVLGALPGEVSARLAYAAAAELDGVPATAADHYRGVWVTDPTVAAAGYGLARCLLATAHGDVLAAVLEAAGVVEQLPAGDDRDEAKMHLMRFALERCPDRLDGDRQMFGALLSIGGIGAAYERVCRALAARTTDRHRRFALIDAANRHRPVTWW